MLTDLRSQPSGRFENFCCMSAIDFECLQSRIERYIAKQDKIYERVYSYWLEIALRFFTTGDNYASLSYLYKVSKQTVSRCVDEVSGHKARAERSEGKYSL